MKRAYLLLATAVIVGLTAIAVAADAPAPKDQAKDGAFSGKFFKAEEATSDGSAAGVSYTATAGTLVVHPAGWDDAAQNGGSKNPSAKDDESSAEASMFFVYYAKKGPRPEDRPITFLFNGGPGSSTVWLHMGAFGPKRVVTADDTHTPAAPYSLVTNDSSLLDASDLVFIDAPGTGFSRIAGKDKEKSFFSFDPDAQAFSNFIREFLSKYNRWNSPKYLFGESYGTPRAAMVVNDLETNNSVDFNGVIMLSQVLNLEMGPDGIEGNPGNDIPYVLALPTYAATAWYHHKIPGQQPKDLTQWVQAAERFATTDYTLALMRGASLPQAQRLAIANKLHAFTGLPVSYILKADLRIEGGEFEKMLQDSSGMTTGRLDTRFSGPPVDPLGKEADYDPQSSAISSAYVSAFNHYARNELHYGDGKTYRPTTNVGQYWEAKHQTPNNGTNIGTPNVMVDLANAMIQNPKMKVMVNGGYFDLATPYYEGWYEMHHMPMPVALQSNISYHYYPSGHMVYAHPESLKELHDAVAGFIRQTSNLQ